jgi:amidohydrolase
VRISSPASRVPPSLALLVPALALAAASASAQETPTEREAARGVVQKLDALQRSVDAAGWAARLTGPNPGRDRVASRAKELMDTELLAMSDDITRNPEVGFQERRSVAKLAEYLTAHGFAVKVGAAGLPTAFVATYGERGPTLGVIVEYDALRGTKGAFHGDQHSAQGPVGLAAAVAVAEQLARTKTPGRVAVFGAPAEEMMPPVSKTQMFDSSLFAGVDVLVRSHSSTATTRPAPGFGTCCLNIDGVKYVFTGAPAHQMTAWNGRNALTAVIRLFDNIDGLRSNIRPEARIQGVITEGGAAPNVVPDRTVADFYVRYPDEVYLQQVRQLVDDAARGAALATGTKVRVEQYGKMRDGISVATLAEPAFAYMKKYGATNVQPEPGKPQGYEETGSVSSAIPGIGFSAHSSNGAYHTYEMERDALGEVGHRGFTVDAQAMAALLWDFATRADFRAVVKREFDAVRGLHREYLDALRSAYPTPEVAEP